MSNIRKRGLAYLKKVLRNIPSDPIVVSKFFKAEESWTKKPAWWFDLPISKIQNNRQGVYYLVGESKKSGFVILKVPNESLVEMLKKESFETRYKNAIRLHLAAEGRNRFVDERGKDHVDFSRFLIHPRNTRD